MLSQCICRSASLIKTLHFFFFSFFFSPSVCGKYLPCSTRCIGSSVQPYVFFFLFFPVLLLASTIRSHVLGEHAACINWEAAGDRSKRVRKLKTHKRVYYSRICLVRSEFTRTQSLIVVFYYYFFFSIFACFYNNNCANVYRSLIFSTTTWLKLIRNYVR